MRVSGFCSSHTAAWRRRLRSRRAAFVNAGSFAAGPVAPGSIVSIFGAGLAIEKASASAVPLPTALDDVASVTFNGVPAPLYFVSPSQINAQVPWNVLPAGTTSGTAQVVVTRAAAGSSAAQSVPISAAAAGIFTTASNGVGQAIATDNSDGMIAAPAGYIPGSLTHPITVGTYLVIWCTGLGAVDATVANGAPPAGQTANTLQKPSVLIGGTAATLVYSVLSPQYPGEYQLAVQVASGTPTGDAVPLQIRINGALTEANVTIAVAAGSTVAQPQFTDCTLSSAGCTPVGLQASDPYSTAGAFAGYADATIRQDPQTGTLWMAYSWPHTIPSGKAGVAGTQVLDIHLAYSLDAGKTWTYKGTLYSSQAMTNPLTGATDYTAHEVLNLLPQVVNGVTYWYGIHSTYNVPQSSGGSGVENYTKRWEIAVAPGTAADGPMALASATGQFLGQNANTYPQYWPVAVNLSSLDPEVSVCEQYYEPALVISGANLYLFLDCIPASNASGGKFYAVFKTAALSGNGPNWTWTYIKEGSTKFANQSDAASVDRYLAPGATYLTQMDVAPGSRSGVLLAIVTAAYDTSTDASGKVSLGCAAVELASVDPPRFVYNSQGQVQVDAFLTSSDSQTGGPGSCTYSPYSATGMILAHRQSAQAPQNGGFFTFLMQSLLFP